MRTVCVLCGAYVEAVQFHILWHVRMADPMVRKALEMKR